MRQAKQNWSSEARKLALQFAVVMVVSARALGQAHAADAADRRIVISIPDRQLALVSDGRVVKVYPVAVGADVSPSPAGAFRIVNRLENPAYYHAGKVIPAGRRNPLGSRWMGLDRKSYGIHGTNQPGSIGKAASHGCIRMAHADLEELFKLVRVGDTVEIHAERDEQVAAIFAAQPATVAAAQSATAATSVAGDLN